MKTYQDLFSYLKSASSILVAAALAVACGGGGGGSNNNGIGVVNGNIVGELGSTSSLVGGGSLLFDTVSDYGNPSYPSVEFSLQFWGQPYNYSGGIVAAQGTMTVQDTSCYIPVGQYTIETSGQAGQYQVSNNTLVNIQYLVSTSGPAAISFSLPNVSIINPGTAINHDVYGVQHQYRMANYNNYINVYVNNYPACQMTVY